VRTLTDAGYAGKARSDETSLCYCEGMSATGYPKKVRGLVKDGINLYGYIYGKGKPVNAENVSVQKLCANEEYANLKKALGLMEGVDYEMVDNRAKLRYGELLIMADADTDGFHIIGLIIHMLNNRFPSLLKAGFVKVWCSPIIRVSKGKMKFKFFTEGEYDKWRARTPDYENWEHSYFKGLATSSDEEIKEDVNDPHKITIRFDQYSDDYLKLAFTKGYEDLRKKWIDQYAPTEFDIRDRHEFTISQFIAYQLILYSIYNVHRSLPGAMDGLKLSQRKCVEGMFRIWGAEAGKDKNAKKKIDKIANITNDHTNYQHGVNSLYGALQKMSQDYPGSNNLPIFIQRSQVGTRDMLGKDAGKERYTDISPNPVIRRSLFRQEDEIILEYLNIEGKKCEPKTFLPVLPLLLINGSEGIGTGSACSWTSYNIFDLGKNVLRFLDGKKMTPLIPYYQGFEGEVTIERESVKEKPCKNNLDLCFHKFGDSPILRGGKCERVTIKGKVEVITEKIGKRKTSYAVISEIPIGKAISDYRGFLQGLVETKAIKSFDDGSTANHPHFTIHGDPSIYVMENLDLIKNMKLTNLVAINEREEVERFDTAVDYLEWWCPARLEHYDKRRVALIKYKEEEIERLAKNIDFLNAYLTGQIKVRDREEEDIRKDMENLGFDFALLSKTTLNQLSKTRFEKLKKNKEEEEQVLDAYRKTPAKEIWRREIKELMEDYAGWLRKSGKDPKAKTPKV